MEEERIYSSLADIERRKRKLKNELMASERVVRHLWKGIFHKRDRRVMTPVQRLYDILSTSVNVLDGVLLGWKLYKKLKR